MAAPTGLEDLKILIVDDNAQMRTIVGTALSGAGIRQVYYAPDGQKGLETLNRWTPDIVFVDFEMPIMNGLEFLRLVRSPESKQRTVPIIMLTGHSDMPRLNMARDRGVNEFLAKPVTANAIFGRLTNVIYRPRPFVDAKGYFGPDRRRKKSDQYAGPLRRTSDHSEVQEL